MGLTRASTGVGAVDCGRDAGCGKNDRKLVVLAGNPNVGKSTVFNQLTGLRQHTGNWSGKTVANARGICTYNDTEYELVDVPGCYSLSPMSAEEEVARDILSAGTADVVVVVCAASCLARGINLALQVMELTSRVVVCVNLMDEAERKGISIDIAALSGKLGVPVVAASARRGKGLGELMAAVELVASWQYSAKPCGIQYPMYIESAVRWIKPEIGIRKGVPARRAAVELLVGERTPQNTDLYEKKAVMRRLEEAKRRISEQGVSEETLRDNISSAGMITANRICEEVISGERCGYSRTDRIIDRLVPGKWSAYPVMMLLLLVVFWITLTGANYPSELLRRLFSCAEGWLNALLEMISCPGFVREMLVSGMFRSLGWVVSVMLPPMAIFFPLFTILEDSGFLPRLAFNMDHCFKRCGACGKQALTICMGFGCNAAGVTGCRIIDSPRERMIAIITNALVPCNGRFPMLAAIITMFITAGVSSGAQSVLSALILAGAVVLSIAVTFAVSKMLSVTVLRGVPSSFVLELPPYRMPQWGKVIVRSMLDRTLFVLGRAVITAAPAGLILWLMANISIDGNSLLMLCSQGLDGIGRFIGLDGVILLAFILGFPANEIVVPIIIMIYAARGELTDMSSIEQTRMLFVENGWTWVTGVCMVLFSLMHWPCSTTCITIYKETRSLKWTALAVLIPTILGIAACAAFNFIAGMFV